MGHWQVRKLEAEIERLQANIQAILAQLAAKDAVVEAARELLHNRQLAVFSRKLDHLDDALRALDKPCDDERIYPCDDCGKMRSKNEGGTTFTVCDECWDKQHGKNKPCETCGGSGWRPGYIDGMADIEAVAVKCPDCGGRREDERGLLDVMGAIADGALDDVLPGGDDE